MKRLLRYIRRILVAAGVLKAHRKPRRPRPKDIAAGPYRRCNTGSHSQSILTALEALIEIGEEILDRLPAVEDDD